MKRVPSSNQIVYGSGDAIGQLVLLNEDMEKGTFGYIPPSMVVAKPRCSATLILIIVEGCFDYEEF